MTSGESEPERAGRRRFLGLCLAGAAVPLAGCAREPAMTRHDAAAASASAGLDGIAETRVDADGIPLAALVAGRGEPPVVMIHGASGNARDFSFGAIQGIAARNAAVAFDRPGLGRSEAPAEGVESPFVQAAHLAAGARALGLRRPILVGHSYGGSVALAWALAEPEAVRGLVLLATPSQVWEGGVGLTSDLLASDLVGPLLAGLAPRVLPRSVIDTAVARVFAPQAPPPGYAARLGPERLLDTGSLRINARQLTALKGHIREMAPRYPGLTMPVELLHGDADTVVPLAIHSVPTAAALPRGRLTVLEGIGHMPHHARPDALLDAVARVAAS